MERGEQFEPFHRDIGWPGLGPDFYQSSDRFFDHAPFCEEDCWISLGNAAAAVVESAAIAMELASLCESPIEIDLAVQLTKALRVIDDPSLLLRHQFKLGRFRYDLSVERETQIKPLILIECDGKEFHSNDEQVASDCAKDALARKEGILLLRFSGSEIFRNVKGCRYLVLKMLRMGGHLTQRDWNALELAQMI